MALNFDWIQRSFLGGSEPLFVLLILASLLFARKESWKTASLLASLATVVRPIGIPLLLALGVVLLARQQYKMLAASMAVSIVIGCLYVLPLWVYFGDPLATYHGYHGDWNSRSPLGFPFRALWMGAVAPQRP